MTNGELLFNGDRISVLHGEMFWRLGILTRLHGTLKMVKVVNFTLSVFYHNYIQDIYIHMYTYVKGAGDFIFTQQGSYFVYIITIIISNTHRA